MGLPIFLDALELLLAADLPLFRARIVGGGPAEALAVECALSQTNGCSASLRAGRIEVWSRVERAALPELYSRSTVVCIPSLREQFGMVAVEAMMCGTPVVASRTGGLQDLILHDLTGYLVDRLNPAALAAALAQFVRNPGLTVWMGRNALLWSQKRFDLELIARRYIDLFESLGRGLRPTRDKECGPSQLRERMIEADRPSVERLLGASLATWQDVSSSPTPSFVTKTESGRYFVKLHQSRPPSLSCLAGAGNNARHMYDPADQIKLAKLLSSASVVPRVICSDNREGILIQEFLLDDPLVSEELAVTRMLQASAEIQSLVTVSEPAGERFLSVLRSAAVANKGDEVVGLVDEAATELSSILLDVKPPLRQCHPQIELVRIENYLRKNSWAVRPEFAARAKSVVRFLMSERPLVCAVPRLQHGSMKREHLMKRPNGSAAVCDLDHAGLYVGPHDIAHWFHDQHVRETAPAPFRMLGQIHSLSLTDDDRFLGAVWLAVFPIFNALWRFARGDWSSPEWDMQFLTTYPEAFRKVFTQSRESADIL